MINMIELVEKDIKIVILEEGLGKLGRNMADIKDSRFREMKIKTSQMKKYTRND